MATGVASNVRTNSGPLWDISWIKVSEATEKHPSNQASTVLGHDLPEAIKVLKAICGDWFDEKNVRRASKQGHSNVIVGIPGRKNEIPLARAIWRMRCR